MFDAARLVMVVLPTLPKDGGVEELHGGPTVVPKVACRRGEFEPADR